MTDRLHERHGVEDHRPFESLLNNLFGLTTTGPWLGESTGDREISLTKGYQRGTGFSYHDVIMILQVWFAGTEATAWLPQWQWNKPGSLQWRHNGCHVVSIQQQLDSLFNSLCKQTPDKTSKPFVRGIHQSPVDFPRKGPVMQKVFP